MVKTILAGKPGGSNTKMNELLTKLNENELISEPGKRFPVDLHPKIHRQIGELQLRISTPEGKKVTNKMIITEAIVDVLNKYEAASKDETIKTDYVFKVGDTFKNTL
jgi:predicted DNA-binding antitoxin AbrB/MazE fold protein